MFSYLALHLSCEKARIPPAAVESTNYSACRGNKVYLLYSEETLKNNCGSRTENVECSSKMCPASEKLTEFSDVAQCIAAYHQ